MVRLEDHLKAAAKNNEFQKYVEKEIPPYQEWGITVLFYKVLHHVEAYFAKKYIHPMDHGERIHFLRQDRKITLEMRDIYISVKDKSEDARYNFAEIHEDEYDDIRNDCITLIEFFDKLRE